MASPDFLFDPISTRGLLLVPGVIFEVFYIYDLQTPLSEIVAMNPIYTLITFIYTEIKESLIFILLYDLTTIFRDS